MDSCAREQAWFGTGQMLAWRSIVQPYVSYRHAREGNVLDLCERTLFTHIHTFNIKVHSTKIRNCVS